MARKKKIQEQKEDDIEDTEEKAMKYRCPFENCEYKTHSMSNLKQHVGKVHGMTLSWKVSEESKGHKRGASKMDEYVEEEEEFEELPIGKKWELQGQMRKWQRKIHSLPKEQQEELMVELNMLEKFIMQLAKKNITTAEILEIEQTFQDSIVPSIEHYLQEKGLDIVSKKVEKKTDELTHKMRHKTLKEEIRQLLYKIYKLPKPKREELEGIKVMIMELNRNISQSDVSQEDLDEIESILYSEIKPAIEAAVEEPTSQTSTQIQKNVSLEPGKMLEEEIQRKKMEYENARLNRMLTEERLMQEKMMQQLGAGQQNNQLVPVMVPKIDPNTGQIMTDDKGNPIMEVTYRPAVQYDPVQVMMMQALTKMNNPETPAIIKTLGDLVRANIEANRNNQNPQIELYKTMFEFMKEMGKRDTGESETIKLLREEINQSREAMYKVMNELYKREMEHMREKMEEYAAYAQRDPLDEIQRRKAQLEELGIVGSASKDAESKAIEESSKLLKEAINKVDTIATTIERIASPFVNAQAEMIKAQAKVSGLPGKQITQLSDEEKLNRYRRMLKKIEEMEEGEE